MTEKENKSIVEHWVSLLYLKNYLATLSSEELCEFASDFNFFQSFLFDSKALFKEEPVFLLLDSSFLEKISDVVNCYRFQFSGKLVSELSKEDVPFYKKIGKSYRYALDTKNTVQKVKKS